MHVNPVALPLRVRNRTTFTLSAIVAAILLSYGLREALQVAPTEATMGNIQRIFYYHVPSYAVAFTMFAVNLLASIFYLVKRNTSHAAAADAVAVSAAELGVIFCSVGLMTGMFWAKPVWGIWWTWDARLTSTFVLWLIYVSYLMLRHLSAGDQAPTLAAALAIFVFVDVPIVYMSIRWWRTQHPQPVICFLEFDAEAIEYERTAEYPSAAVRRTSTCWPAT